jgi:hypothetical protein
MTIFSVFLTAFCQISLERIWMFNNQFQRRALQSLILGNCLFFVAAASAEDSPSVTPYRPTVSNPAQLSQAGWLEVESGFNRSRSEDASWRNNLPYTLKLALSQDFGILLGGDASVTQADANGEMSGFGDTLLLLKNRFGATENSAFGVEYGLKAATAPVGLGTGKTDYLVNGIFSTEIRAHTIDLNLGVTQLGANQPNEGVQQVSWATTLSRPAGEFWTVAAEFSGTSRQGVMPTNQFLVAGSYAMNRRLVLDLGVARGISTASPQWSGFFGVSFLAGKVF